MYLHPEGGGETAGSNAPGAFLVFRGFLTDEVELEQSCQEGRLVWSVKIRRVRLTRCVFRYGPRDGMTYSVIKPID